MKLKKKKETRQIKYYLFYSEVWEENPVACVLFVETATLFVTIDTRRHLVLKL